MMAKASVPVRPGLDTLARAAAEGGPRPVHEWNPPFCGDVDIRIARDGTWFHEGSPIGRPALVRLFASVLRRDPDGFMLVTPVEKVRITVEDAPFTAVELAAAPGAPLRFRTNVDEWVEADEHHPLRFGAGAADGLKPYLTVRPGLEALATRAVFIELADRGEVRLLDGEEVFGVASGARFFPMAPADALAGLV